ncbi:DUF2834 domain-containing protein [Paracoccus pacificus]|uniref:DUF2834 domain-containing protein n=1 Tax=Paracoccus pacificus TaxID=1463598 RepID=A0ABW4R3B7_9RHOB
MTPLRLVWLAAAVVGAALHLIYAEGFGPDGIVAAAVLAVWVLVETSVRRNWLALIVLPATAFLGVGCGLPLYLFLRARKVM